MPSNTAATNEPVKLPIPPNTTIINTSMDFMKVKSPGVTAPSVVAESVPPILAVAAPHTKAKILYFVT